MLFEHRAGRAKDCGRESWGALEAAIHASVCSGGALSDGVCFGNNDVERDIGARVYDVLETQIGELDLPEEPPTTNGETIARPYGPISCWSA